MSIRIIDFGYLPYEEALLVQKEYFNRLIANKISQKKSGTDYLLLGEHPPVITLGVRGKVSNILISDELLFEKGIKTYKITRGGDVTYHGPGQLILYPIIDLENHHLRVKEYINLLEESVIILLEKYGIKGGRIDGATGVWIGKGTENERKICAIGVKCSRFCTMHGLALNINPDLSGFSLINPCGFINKGVTSMKNERDQDFDIANIKKELSDIFLSLIFPF